MTSTQTYTLSNGTTSQVTPDLPCSLAGTTSISYSITDYNGVAHPSWVTINSSTGQLTIIAPGTITTSSYSFYVSSAITGVTNSVNKIITISLINWSALNCQYWVSTSGTVWATWNSGYSLSLGAWTLIPTNTQSTTSSTSSTTTTTTQSKSTAAINLVSQLNTAADVDQTTITTSMAVSAAFLVVSNAVSSSSVSSIWLMINQIQIFFLFLLTRAFLPDSVKQVITGPSVLLNPFEFISFLGSENYGSSLKNVGFDLNNSLLKSLKLKSQSTITNLFASIMGIIYLIIFHILVFALKTLIGWWRTDRRWSTILKILKFMTEKLFELFTYSLYIRLALVLFLFILVSGINEVYYTDVSNKYRIISFAFAVAILILWFLFTLFVIFFSISSYTTIEGQHNKLNEFFNGLKINKKHRFSVAILLIRRSFFVIFLFACYSVSSKVVIGVLSLFQLSYLVYIIIIRPFVEIKANIIEIVNESIFLFLLSALFFLNTENDWTTAIAIVYMQIIWLNFVLIWAIITGTFNFLIFSIHNKLIRNLASKEENSDGNADEERSKQFWSTL